MPEIRELQRSQSWKRPSTMTGVAGADIESQMSFLRGCCLPLLPERLRLGGIYEYACQENGKPGYGPVEAEFLFCFITTRRPSRIVQVGCGVSTAVILLAAKEADYTDLEGWRSFLCHLKDRGSKGVKLIISDACRGLVEAAAEVYPGTDWQRCTVHFYRNVFSHVPNGIVAEIARMLKAIHAQEDRRAAENKGKEIVMRLKEMRLRTAAELVEQKVGETLTYYAYPSTHWRRVRTNNPLERIIREIRRRTRVVGAFPDGHSALMLTAARLRHIASTKWGKRRYLVMELLLNPAKQEAAAWKSDRQPPTREMKVRKILDTTCQTHLS